MNGSRGERIAAAAGIAFAGLLAAAIVLTVSGAPDSTRASHREIASYYTSHGGRLELAAFLIGIGSFCFLVFMGALRAVLRRAEGERGGLSTVAFGAGVASAALLLVGGACGAAVATAADWYDAYSVNADVARTFELAAFWAATYAGIAGGVLVGATSILAVRTRVLPKWLAYLGFPVALVGLVGMINWGMGLPVVGAWILLTSIVLTVRPATSIQPAKAAPTPA